MNKSLLVLWTRTIVPPGHAQELLRVIPCVNKDVVAIIIELDLCFPAELNCHCDFDAIYVLVSLVKCGFLKSYMLMHYLDDVPSNGE